MMRIKTNMTFEEAVEWVEFNVLSAYLGDFTPIHIWTIPTKGFWGHQQKNR
jgi:hypothetical protein